jgi:hypothetical protein
LRLDAGSAFSSAVVWLAALFSALTGFGRFVIFSGPNDVPDSAFFMVPAAFAIVWFALVVASLYVRGKGGLWLLASAPLAALSAYMLLRLAA